MDKGSEVIISDKPTLIKATPNHQLIKIPVQNYTVSLEHEKRKSISIIVDNQIVFPKAYLRKVLQDTMSPSGISAEVEIPQDKIHLIKKYQGSLWQLYPHIKKKPNTKKGYPYEVNI